MRPFLRHVMRGLATALPPALTLIVVVVAWQMLDRHLFRPLHAATIAVVAKLSADIRSLDAIASPEGVATVDGQTFIRVGDVSNRYGGRFVPVRVVEAVERHAAGGPVEGMATPRTARDVYRRYVEIRWLPRRWFLPVSIVLLIALVYAAGKVGNRGFGRLVRRRVQRTIRRMPFVRRVYAAVQQVTQHILAGPKFKFSRIVAVEFPRKGTWCVAYVIKEGLAQVADKAQEPVLTLFFDTTPIPMSGYTIMVKKSETIPLDMAIDDAFKWVMSGGIIVPPRQQPPRATVE